ncbi:MAG: hypothetical protein ACK5T0_06395 [Vampirovibrionales bacterium]
MRVSPLVPLTLTSSGRNIQRQGGRKEIVVQLEALASLGYSIEHKSVQDLLKAYPPQAGKITNVERKVWNDIEKKYQEKVQGRTDPQKLASLEKSFGSSITPEQMTSLEEAYKQKIPTLDVYLERKKTLQSDIDTYGSNASMSLLVPKIKNRLLGLIEELTLKPTPQKKY